MKRLLLIAILFFIYASTHTVVAQKFIDFYKIGAKKNQEQKWAEAVEALELALKVSATDVKSVASRTGRPSEYYPNRELGIAFLMQGKKEEAKRYLEKSFADEPTERAKEYLLKLDPNWQDPRLLADIPKLPKPLFEKERIEQNLQTVEGGQDITIKISIRNEGEGRFEKGLIRIIPQLMGKGIEFEPTVAIGDVRSGATRTVQVTIHTNGLLVDGKAAFLLRLEGESGTAWDETPIAFKTLTPPAPLIKIVGLMAANDTKLVLEKGRRVKNAKLVLKNEGRGKLNKPSIVLILNEQPVTIGGPALSAILAGESVTIPCELFVSSAFTQPNVPLSVRIQENGGTYNLNEKLTVAVQEPLTPLVHFDKETITWEGMREGFVTLLSQPSIRYNIVNESDELAKDLVVKMVQTPINPGFNVPTPQKIAIIAANKMIGEELKLGVFSKLLKDIKTKFTLRLENTQGKLLDKIEVDAPILLPPKQSVALPSVAETNALIEMVTQNLDSKFIQRISLMGDQFDDFATKKNYLIGLLKDCLRKGSKALFYNDIVPPELIANSKFSEKLTAETYLNNALLWYDSYQVDYQLEKALYSPIQFNDKGDAFMDVYIEKSFVGISKSTDFKEVKVTNNNLLQIKYTFKRNKQKDGKWTSSELYIEGIEKISKDGQLAESNFNRQQWEAKEAEETNDMMSLSAILNPLIETVKNKLPATAKRLVSEPFMEKGGKYGDKNTFKLQNQFISAMESKRLKWIDATDWEPIKAVPGEDFILEGKYELVSNGLKLSLILRNFRTFETITEASANIGMELLGAVKSN